MGIEIFAAVIVAAILTLSIEYLRSSRSCKGIVCFSLVAFVTILAAWGTLHLLLSPQGNAVKISEEQKLKEDNATIPETDQYVLPPLVKEEQVAGSQVEDVNAQQEEVSASLSPLLESSAPPLPSDAKLPETDFSAVVDFQRQNTDIIGADEPHAEPGMPEYLPENSSRFVLPPSQTQHLTEPVDLDKEIRVFLDRWQAAWEGSAGRTGDMESFADLYSQEFTQGNMNREQWKADKATKNRRKNWIRIEVENIDIGPLRDDNTLQVHFVQNYSSSNFTDQGTKSLTLKREQGNWQILAEK